MKTKSNRNIITIARYRWPFRAEDQDQDGASSAAPSDADGHEEDQDDVEEDEGVVEARQVGAPLVPKRGRGQAAVAGLDAVDFASLDVRGAHAGWSRKCQVCGYSRNIYNVKSGLSDVDAQRRLIRWEGECPGLAADHKALKCGNLLAMFGYD